MLYTLRQVQRCLCSALIGFTPALNLRALLLCLVLWLGLADAPAAQNFQTARLVAQPPVVALSGAAAEHGLVITALDKSGRTLDVTSRARYTSSQPGRIVVATNGTVRGLAEGMAEILVEFGGRSVKVPVTARNTDTRAGISFRQDIEPVITRSEIGRAHV